MSVIGRVLLLGLLASSSLVLSCQKSQKPPGSEGGEGTEIPPEVFGKTAFNPQLAVVDQAGAPIANASIVFGSSSVRSLADGTAALPEQSTEASTVATVSAEGYAPVTKTLSISNSYTPLTIELSKLVSVVVDSETGGNVDLAVAQVRLPGRGFLKEDGSPYDGPVTVRVVNLLDPLSAVETTSDDGFGVGADGPEPLVLYGAIHVELLGADGKPLQFSAGERAVVSFDLPTDVSHQVGDVLAMYTFDEASGLWLENSSCKVADATPAGGARKLACVGEVEHFSKVATGNRRNIGRFCRKFTLKLSKGFPQGGSLLSWRVEVPGRSFSCRMARPSAGTPLGTCTLRAALSGRPDEVRIRSVIGSRAFRRFRQYFAMNVPGSYDGTCPETILQYNPLTRRLSITDPPPDRDPPVDMDGDGYYAKAGATLEPGEDCDDNDKDIHPGARPVICTGKDHDCDGQPDVAKVAASLSALPDLAWNLFCPQTKMTCSAVLGAEVSGNGRDENCDGVASDADGDGFLTRSDPGFAASGKAPDCNDNDSKSKPGGTEVKGNLIDEDCDGVAADKDNDGFPSARELALAGQSLTTTGVDCNDIDPEAHPGSAVQDLPVLAEFYEGGTRNAEFCSLFDAQGRPNQKLNYLLFQADRNCNGVLEDLDGDGKLVPAAGVFANPPPYDGNDLDPRTQDKNQSGSPNAKACSADLSDFGSGAREVCPRLFNRQQVCVDTYNQDGTATGEFACGSPDWKGFAIPPDPFAFGQQYGPCSTMVLPDCGAQSLCGGPITLAPWYTDALKNSTPAYDVSAENFTGFCMPTCTVVQ